MILLSATKRGAVRRDLDFYATPPEAVTPILPVLAPYLGGPILEPSIGAGDIARVLVGAGVAPRQITGIELDTARAAAALAAGVVGTVIQGDALVVLPSLAVPGGRRGLVIGNPPYRQALDFARASLEVVGDRGVVALLLRLGWAASQRRIGFHRAHPSGIFVLPSRPSFTGDGQTDAADYAWFCWGLPAAAGRWFVLDPT